MLFSIITPTYNSDKTLNACINSVLNQSFTDYEHIIIDGESKDRTIKIVTSYSHLKWISEPDNGIYDAMNKGVKLAKGDWLYFLGADDRLYDNNILNIVSKELTQNTINIIYGDVILANSGKKYGGVFSLKRLAENNICHQAIFYKKILFERNGLYNTSFTQLADYDFNIKILNSNSTNAKYLNQIIAVYNEEGISKQDFDLNFWQSREKINIHHFKGKVPKKTLYRGLQSYFYYLLNTKIGFKKIGFIFRFLLFTRDLNYLKDFFYLLIKPSPKT